MRKQSKQKTNPGAELYVVPHSHCLPAQGIGIAVRCGSGTLARTIRQNKAGGLFHLQSPVHWRDRSRTRRDGSKHVLAGCGQRMAWHGAASASGHHELVLVRSATGPGAGGGLSPAGDGTYGLEESCSAHLRIGFGFRGSTARQLHSACPHAFVYDHGHDGDGFKVLCSRVTK